MLALCGVIMCSPQEVVNPLLKTRLAERIYEILRPGNSGVNHRKYDIVLRFRPGSILPLDPSRGLEDGSIPRLHVQSIAIILPEYSNADFLRSREFLLYLLPSSPMPVYVSCDSLSILRNESNIDIIEHMDDDGLWGWHRSGYRLFLPTNRRKVLLDPLESTRTNPDTEAYEIDIPRHT